jgi:hypothetical protein
MKRIKNFLKSRNVVINMSPEIKMSELIGAYASDYINMGENTEERQNYLNGACTAWNIAVLPEHSREEALRRVMKEYKKANPGVDDADGFEQNLRTLIRKKLEMFPEIKKVIVNAGIEPISDTKYRILVVSTDDREALKHLLA